MPSFADFDADELCYLLRAVEDSKMQATSFAEGPYAQWADATAREVRKEMRRRACDDNVRAQLDYFK